MATSSPGQKGKGEFQQSISFRVEEHNVVKNMRPMVKEIVNKMKVHANELSQFQTSMQSWTSSKIDFYLELL